MSKRQSRISRKSLVNQHSTHNEWKLSDQIGNTLSKKLTTNQKNNPSCKTKHKDADVNLKEINIIKERDENYSAVKEYDGMIRPSVKNYCCLIDFEENDECNNYERNYRKSLVAHSDIEEERKVLSEYSSHRDVDLEEEEKRYLEKNKHRCSFVPVVGLEPVKKQSAIKSCRTLKDSGFRNKVFGFTFEISYTIPPLSKLLGFKNYNKPSALQRICLLCKKEKRVCDVHLSQVNQVIDVEPPVMEEEPPIIEPEPEPDEMDIAAVPSSAATDVTKGSSNLNEDEDTNTNTYEFDNISNFAHINLDKNVNVLYPVTLPKDLSGAEAKLQKRISDETGNQMPTGSKSADEPKTFNDDTDSKKWFDDIADDEFFYKQQNAELSEQDEEENFQRSIRFQNTPLILHSDHTKFIKMYVNTSNAYDRLTSMDHQFRKLLMDTHILCGNLVHTAAAKRSSTHSSAQIPRELKRYNYTICKDKSDSSILHIIPPTDRLYKSCTCSVQKSVCLKIDLKETINYSTDPEPKCMCDDCDDNYHVFFNEYIMKKDMCSIFGKICSFITKIFFSPFLFNYDPLFNHDFGPPLLMEPFQDHCRKINL